MMQALQRRGRIWGWGRLWAAATCSIWLGAALSLAAEPVASPGALTIKFQNDNVVLQWSAPSSTGIKNYVLERSVDNAVWQTLSDSIITTQYVDTTAGFNVHYFYRLKAVNADGAASPYIAADINTAKFVSNVTTSAVTTVKSDDGKVVINIPAGATPSDASCHVSTTYNNSDQLATRGKKRLGDPAGLVCRDATGQDITQLDQPASAQVDLTGKSPDRYGQIQVWQFDSKTSAWHRITASYDGQHQRVSFQSKVPAEFVVLGVPSQSTPWLGLLWIIPLAAVIFAVAIWYALRRQQQNQYEEYLRRKYYEL
jgi:hypothetical protein